MTIYAKVCADLRAQVEQLKADKARLLEVILDARGWFSLTGSAKRLREKMDAEIAAMKESQ